ncbi:MAG TPA: DUF2723 domain-containing protein [Candidatus Limnocylindrales bacterium]|nr:DUF2723 domain-containing protein [Candidatus Limnocylindrales bacterium]
MTIADGAERDATPVTDTRARLTDWSVLASWAAAIGVGLLAFALCIWRLMPGLGFWDTAEFQTVLPVMGTAHPTGYPTYVLLGWLASLLLTPIGEPALRINVLSAILVGLGAGLTVDLARRLTGSLVMGLVAGVGVALTPIVWAIGTRADPHALHFTLLILIVWLLVRWEQARRGNPADPDSRPIERARADRWLVAAAVVTGISTGNHSLTLLLGPPIVLYVLAVAPDVARRPRLIATCLAAAAIPAVLVRLELPLRAGWFRAPFVYADPSTWDGFWYVTLGQQFHGWITDPLGDWPRRISDLTTIAGQQLGPLAPLILVAFAVTAVRLPRYALLSGSAAAITCFFNSVYPDGAIDRYYIGPAVFAWTWLAILGATFVEAMLGNIGLAQDGPDDAGELPAVPFESGPARSATPARVGRFGAIDPLRVAGVIVVAGLLLAPSLLALSDRATTVDRSHDRSAQAWVDDVLSAVEPNAVVISWWSYSTPLWYEQIVAGRRPDIYIIDDRTRLDLNLGELNQVIDRYIATRPVYLIRNGTSELPAVEARFTVASVGAPTASNLLRVTPKTAALRVGGGGW